VSDQREPILHVNWSSHWRNFLDRHGGWWSRVNNGGPVYTVPAKVVDEISTSKPASGNSRRQKAIISSEDAEAERDFRQLCADFAVGVWASIPILYPLLREPVAVKGARLNADQEIGTSRANPISLTETVEESAEQALHFVGTLILNSEYIADRDELRIQTNAACSNCPCSLEEFIRRADMMGLQVAMASQLRGEEDRLSPWLRWLIVDQPELAKKFSEFFSKWEIQRLATWDLPLPQDPRRGVRIGDLIWMVGPDVVVDYYPNHYSIRGSEDVRSQIQARNRMSAIARGREPRGRTGQTTQHIRMLHMWLIESTLRQRYSNPRGLAARLQTAFQDVFRLQEETIRGYRKKYRSILAN